MMRIGACATSLRNCCAVVSAMTPCTRSSVERSTREMSDVKTIVTMKNEAIFSPSGRSVMLTNVV